MEVRICENCSKECENAYGSGRFCGATCARGFSTKAKRLEINIKVSGTLKATYPVKPRPPKAPPLSLICSECSCGYLSHFKNKYCSKSCSRKATNRIASEWRRAHKKPCPKCGDLIYPEAVTCKKCRNNDGAYRGDITLKEAVYLFHHKSSAFALVRSRARTIVRKLGWKSCWVCGYNRHVEAAHIKSIAEFPMDTRLSIINDQTNLATLCRNHHWEYDHNMLEKLVPPERIELPSMT